ncbi:MAG: 30S ribosomal protein S8 [Candidatus Diapherotrites archaeon]|nr:30S ribosomal protein S8 [Candidatus Diapherotrites archaeon]
MLLDPLSDAMTVIKNAEKAGKRECVVKPASKLIGNVLKVMQKHGYVGEFTFIDDSKSGSYQVKLLGRINDCKAIKPRLEVKKGGFERYEKRFLPAQGFGILIMTTPKGVMSQEEAMKIGVGGQLIAFVY